MENGKCKADINIRTHSFSFNEVKAICLQCPRGYDNRDSYHNLSIDLLSISEIGKVQLF